MEKIRYAFGEWLDSSAALTVADVESICRTADSRREALRCYPQDKILRVLAKVGEKWANPECAHRKRLEKILPEATGFSPEMIRLGMNELVWVLKPELLERKVRGELKGLTSAGLPFFDFKTRTELKWSPLGVVMHVLSGNVFLVGVGSLVEGLLTGNVTILKMSSGEKLFLPLLMESLLECDEEGVVARSVALVDYASSQKDVLEEFKKRVDGILVWGGEEAVRAYRDGLGAGKKLIVFGPKLSLAIVTAAGLDTWGVEKIADKLAYEMSIWDQNACTAPQQCFVEGEANALRVAKALPSALEKWRASIPAGPVDSQVAVEIQKMRGVAEVAEAKSEGWVAGAPGNVDWTVIVDRKLTIEPSPLHRTIRVIAFQHRQEILVEAEAIRGYLQTVGLVASSAERGPWYEALTGAGALKVGDLGEMSGGEIEDPHDGSYDLPQLGHFVLGRFAEETRYPIEAMPAAAFQAEVDARLRRLIDHARKAPFYAARLEGVTLNGVSDLSKIAPLTREQMEQNMPPKGMGLSTGPSFGGYVARSGGSTGEPKFSVYDKPDWEAMISEAVRLFRAAGMKEGDRVANFMMAGDLYGSFVSFDHINHKLGAQTFAFANQLDAPLFVKLARAFQINVIQAIPARLLLILREAHRIDPELKIPVVIYAGTAMSKTDREWLKANLGTERISSIIGANDGGQIAFQCEHLSGPFHHTVEDFNYLELVDELGTPVPEGEPGRILITSLLKYAFPLIRYEIGDAGRFVKHQCPCGRQGRVLEYLGRADDQICVGLMNLHYRDVIACLDSLPLSAVQLVVREAESGEELILNVESAEPGEALAAQIREAVLKGVKKIAEGLAENTISNFKVFTHPIAALTRSGRSGKLKTLVDERMPA